MSSPVCFHSDMSHASTTIKNNSSTFKNSFMVLLESSPCPQKQPSANPDLFSIPAVLPFPERHNNGIVEYAVFEISESSFLLFILCVPRWMGGFLTDPLAGGYLLNVGSIWLIFLFSCYFKLLINNRISWTAYYYFWNVGSSSIVFIWDNELNVNTLHSYIIIKLQLGMLLLLLIWQYLWCRINRGNITNSGGRIGITNTTFQFCSKGAGGRLSELPILSPYQSCHRSRAVSMWHPHRCVLWWAHRPAGMCRWLTGLFFPTNWVCLLLVLIWRCPWPSFSNVGVTVAQVKIPVVVKFLMAKASKPEKMGPEALWSLNRPWEEKRTRARNEWKGPAFLGRPLFSFASLCKYHLPTCSPAFFSFLLKHMYLKPRIPESKRSVRFQTEPYVSTHAGSQVTAGLGEPPRAPCVTSERDSHPNPMNWHCLYFCRCVTSNCSPVLLLQMVWLNRCFQKKC